MSSLPRAVVIFGASGFIGRNIVDALAGKVEKLVGVTLSTATVPGCNVTVVADRLESLPPLPADTIVIHAAAHRYNAATFQADQGLVLENNVALAHLVYGFCRERQITEVRLASSVAVYPASFDVLDDDRPFDWRDWPHEGESFYAWSKRWTEIVADLHARRFGINTVTFRLTNPYGPHDTMDVDAAHVATAFVLRSIQSAEVFEIRGNASARRDFVYAGDIAATFVSSLCLRGRSGVWNLAQGETVSIADLAEAALRAAGNSGRRIVASQTNGQAGVAIRAATATRLQRDFDLAPFHDLDSGLAATVNWYRNVVGR